MQLQKRNSSTINVELYRRMVAKAAWAAWRSLPMQTRTWIEVEDMIEDGMLAAWKLANNPLRRRRFDPSRGEFSTVLHHKLHNYFIRNYIEKYGSQKSGWVFCRDKGKLVSINILSLQGMQEKLRDNGTATMDDIVHSIPDLVVSPDTIMEDVMTECFVVPILQKIYTSSSDNLKQQFVDWFWYTRAKVHAKSRPFKQASKEFRSLCREENLTCDDCVHIVRSPTCLDSLSRRIFGIPYSPGSDGCYPIVN